VGGPERLNGIEQATPSAANFDYWVDVLYEYADKRERDKLLVEAAGDESADLAVLGKKMIELSGRRRSRRNDMVKEGDGLLNELDEDYRLGRSLAGHSWGLKPLDGYTSGLEDELLYIVGARPSSGKTTLCCQTALALAKAGVGVMYVTMEMPVRQILMRFAQQESGVSLWKFRNQTVQEDEVAKVFHAIRAIGKLPIEVVDYLSLLSDLVREAREGVLKRGVRVVFVDYLGLIRLRDTFRGTRNDHITEVSNAMKRLAMDAHVPVVCASQLSRASDKEGRKPQLSDLRDSGAVEQDADVAMLLHAEEGKEEVQLRIAKNRSGPMGVIELTFRREITRFDVPRAVADEDVPERQWFPDA